jgi:hypothetical protein
MRFRREGVDTPDFQVRVGNFISKLASSDAQKASEP